MNQIACGWPQKRLNLHDYSCQIFMTTSVHGAELKRYVLAYAAKLKMTYTEDIGTLSSGCQVTPHELYQETTFRNHDEQSKHPGWQPPSDDSEQRQLPISESSSYEGEASYLEKWLYAKQRDPLLVVAPAGAGKSCLLGSFALRMANELLDQQQWEDSESGLPAVPVPILLSLSKVLKAGRTLKDAMESSVLLLLSLAEWRQLPLNNG
jgi:hypothetical protein